MGLFTRINSEGNRPSKRVGPQSPPSIQLQSAKDDFALPEPSPSRFQTPMNVTINGKDKRIIIPRANVDVLQLLRSFGAEVIAEIEKVGHDASHHYQLMTLPDSLSICSGRFAKPGEFKCSEGKDHCAFIPGIIRSKDGQVVVALFETISGPIQLIGPSWAGVPALFTGDGPTLSLPDNVIDVTPPNVELPQGTDWDLFMMGVDELGHYPVKVRCMSSFALANRLSSTSKELTDKFEKLQDRIDDFYSRISVVRVRNLQDYIQNQDRPETIRPTEQGPLTI